MENNNAPLLEMRSIKKDFFGNQVLTDISFTLREGEVLGLVGENGAGKSTLMKILFGMDVIRETGGLKDTVQPYNQYEGTGTGFSFTNYNAHEMLATVRNAEKVFYDNKREWNKMVDRAMAADFSWSHSAQQYEEMYNWLIGDK